MFIYYFCHYAGTEPSHVCAAKRVTDMVYASGLADVLHTLAWDWADSSAFLHGFKALSKLAQSFLQAKVETGAGSQTGSKTTDVNMTTCYKLVHVLNCDVLSVWACRLMLTDPVPNSHDNKQETKHKAITVLVWITALLHHQFSFTNYGF